MAGLARFDGRGFVSVKAPGVPLEGIISILEDRAGTLWFGTAGEGLVRLRDGKFRVLTTNDGLASNKVMALHEDERGSLWIGTGGGGINRLRDGRLVSIRPSDGLWDGIAQTILEDRAGNLWMTCNRGFYRAPLAELDAFAEGRLAKVTSVGYGASDALRSTTFAGGQFPSGAVDSRGTPLASHLQGTRRRRPVEHPGIEQARRPSGWRTSPRTGSPGPPAGRRPLRPDREPSRSATRR